jgi:hypothetical protein
MMTTAEERICGALERQANALEALVLIAQTFLPEEETKPGTPELLVVMTQEGPVEIPR